MLFFLVLAIVKSKKALEDPTPTPTTYPLSVSTRLMTISGDKKCWQHGVLGKDPDCPKENFDDPSTYNCGQTCWSESGKASFSYTFKGVQFLVYGNKTSQYKQFDLYLDGSKIATIDEQIKEGEQEQTFALLYTSKVYDYKEHTITAQGIEGNAFSIFKFAFWPHLKSKRLNISEMQSTGKWVSESDEIGGTREYSDRDLGASKSLMIEASKLWVYGTPDPMHGKLRISFDAIDSVVDTYQAKREDGKLLFESGEIPTTFHQLDLVAVEAKAVLIYCVYYLYDPPERTPMPFPSRTNIPGANTDYIDKEFIKKDVPQISNAKQISGCTFSDITSKKPSPAKGSYVYFIKYDKEGPYLFYDNRIEFSSASTSNPGPLYLLNSFGKGKFTISQCTFVNCVSNDGDGNVVNFRASIALYVEESRFVNCYSQGINNQAIVKFNNQDNLGSVKFSDCIFQFSLDTKACPALYGKCPDATFERCTFSKCGAAVLNDNVNNFVFTDNVVTYSSQQAFSITKLKDRPTITGNSFRFNRLNNTNLITLIHSTDVIEFVNNNFSGNSLVGTGKSIEGGGCGLKVQASSESFLYIKDCHFVENKNDYTDANSNQGGAFSLSLAQTTELNIQRCEFKSNSAKGKGGAIAVSATKDVSIKESTFEGNSATQGGNVMFINIEKIDAEEPKLYVNKCHFIDNGQDKSKLMIEGSCVDMTFDENEIKFTDKSKSCGAFLLTTKGIVVLSTTDFTNCATSASSCVSFEGQNDASTITVSNCHFTNCKASSYTVRLSGGPAQVESSLFTFDSNEESSSCGAVDSTSKSISVKHCTFIKTNAQGSIKYAQSKSNSDPVTISNCVFDDCFGTNKRCFNLDPCYSKDFTFENNVIRNMKAAGVRGYFGLINCSKQIDTFVMTNVTFVDNNCNSEYGGGTGLWIVGVTKIIFNDCKFINNVASSSKRGKQPSGYNDYTSGDGGALQYGFSDSLYGISLGFNKCQFSRNKAVRHGGALGLQTFGTVEITECTFEENVANYQLPASSSTLLEEYFNHFNKKSEGRGGAIYINPTFKLSQVDSSKMFTQSVNIEKCKFTSNSAFDGFAIYIEGNDYGTKFTIKENTFTNNYDGTSNSKNRGVIVSEIESLCLVDDLETSNTFTNPNGIKIFPIVCVDHYARTPESTPMPTLNNLTFATDGSNCHYGCYYTNDDRTESQAFINVDYRPFNNVIDDEKSGGAVYLVNYGLSLIKCSFTNCQTTKHGGGAIYIDNELELSNLVNIENVVFKECKAAYGGAVYIRVTSEECPITITSCRFERNEILESASSDGKGLTGGSAVYLNAVQGTFNDCTFYRNTGKGGVMKVVNEFESRSVKESALIGIIKAKNSISVSDCTFEFIDREMDSSSIYYHTGKLGSSFNVKNCEFRGKPGMNSRHIEGKKNSNDAPLMNLKNCRFEGDEKSSLDIKADFVSLNLNDQVFNYNPLMKNVEEEDNEKESKAVNTITFAALALLTVVVIVVALAVLKSTRSIQNSNDDDDGEDNEVADEPLRNL